SFQPSITAATIMAAQTKVKGQCVRMYDMGEASSPEGIVGCPTPRPVAALPPFERPARSGAYAQRAARPRGPAARHLNVPVAGPLTDGGGHARTPPVSLSWRWC